MLNRYMQDTQDILDDEDQRRFQPADIKRYVNRARRKVAGATQCLRVLAPSSGSLSGLAVSAGGSGYTAPVVTISGPDGIGVQTVQATATASLTGGVVTGLAITNPGVGYVAIPAVTITDPTGSGAVGAASLTAFVAAQPGQEVYTFQSVNPIIQANNPGVSSIISLQSVAVAWGSWKPVQRFMGAWSAFQAYCRAWNVGQENFPTVWSQYGQGESGSIYLFPIPSVVAQMDWDCYCFPLDLNTDEDFEAIPHPFTEAIPYYAAYLGYLKAQNMEMAEKMRQLYRENMAEARAFVSPAMVPDFYPQDP